MSPSPAPSRPTVWDINVATGEKAERAMTDEELTEYQSRQDNVDA